MEQTKNKLLEWIKKHPILVAKDVIYIVTIIFLGVKLRREVRSNKSLTGKNRELEGENKALRVENRQVRKENANLNYQLGKSVAAQNGK